jgi:hypothetical protein
MTSAEAVYRGVTCRPASAARVVRSSIVERMIRFLRRRIPTSSRMSSPGSWAGGCSREATWASGGDVIMAVDPSGDEGRPRSERASLPDQCNHHAPYTIAVGWKTAKMIALKGIPRAMVPI